MGKFALSQKKRHVGRSITRIREAIGMRQETLANALGLSQQMISKYEQLEEVEESLLQRIATGLGVTPEFIEAYTEDRAVVNNTQNNYDSTVMSGSNIVGNQSERVTFNPLDKLIASYEGQIKSLTEMYERLLKEKDIQLQEKDELLRRTKH